MALQGACALEWLEINAFLYDNLYFLLVPMCGYRGINFLLYNHFWCLRWQPFQTCSGRHSNKQEAIFDGKN